MPPEIQELLRRFQGGDGVEPLTDAELRDLRTGLETAAGALYDAGTPTAETVQALSDLAETVEAVDAALESAVAVAAEMQASIDEAISRIRTAAEAVDEQATEQGDEPAEQVAAEADAEVVDEPETVAASAEDKRAAAIERARTMAAARPAASRPRRRSDTPDPGHATVSVVAAGRWTGGRTPINPGDEIPDFDTLAEIMSRKLQALGPTGGTALVASQFTTYPEDRRLEQDQQAGNTRKIDAVSGPMSLMASGGICTPLAVDYTIPTFSVADRPVKAALPAFGASRGGITYLTPPVMSALANSVGAWTHTNDASPSSPATKAVLTVGCATPVDVYVDAVTMRLQFGNMMGRFSPEVVAANTELALAQFARKSELILLAAIAAGSTEVTHTGATLGATPEILSALEQQATAVIGADRLSMNTQMRVILPFWIKPLLRADLARRLPGDGTMNVSDAQLQQFFSARNLNVTYSVDPLPAQSTDYALQGFAVQTAAAIQSYPAKCVALMYPEGTWQFLDGGQLDLGVVRDSTLNATNDYQTFFETFEAVAKRGIRSIKLILPLLPTGSSSGTVDVHTYTGA